MPKEAFTQFSQWGDQKELLGGRETRNSIPTWGWIVGLWAGKMSKKSSSLGAPRHKARMKPGMSRGMDPGSPGSRDRGQFSGPSQDTGMAISSFLIKKNYFWLHLTACGASLIRGRTLTLCNRRRTLTTGPPGKPPAWLFLTPLSKVSCGPRT